MFVRNVRPVMSISSIFYKKPEMTHSHSLNVERDIIARNGGTSNKRLLGPDGKSNFSGRHMEVKYATKGRWRIGRIDHDVMLRSNGIYILVNAAGQQLKLPANELDRYIKYRWLQDLRKNGTSYEHAFVYGDDIHFK
jgi:hypothetical protein